MPGISVPLLVLVLYGTERASGAHSTDAVTLTPGDTIRTAHQFRQCIESNHSVSSFASHLSPFRSQHFSIVYVGLFRFYIFWRSPFFYICENRIFCLTPHFFCTIFVVVVYALHSEPQNSLCNEGIAVANAPSKHRTVICNILIQYFICCYCCCCCSSRRDTFRRYNMIPYYIRLTTISICSTFLFLLLLFC